MEKCGIVIVWTAGMLYRLVAGMVTFEISGVTIPAASRYNMPGKVAKA